ncbi:MAG: hypothetical protein RLZZ153_2437 [Pseudomonadota bacterium]|jgi:drug/metabolite transporter (DMT)-like permease
MSLHARDLAQMISLGAIWGSSFLFMRVAGPQFGLALFASLRGLIAAVLVLPLLLREPGALMAMRAHTGWLLVTGILNSAIPYTLFTYVALEIGVGTTAVINSTAPLFGAMIARAWIGERLPRFGVLGLLLGFSGVATLVLFRDAFSGNPAAAGAGAIVPMLIGLFTAACSGASATVARRHLRNLSPLASTVGSQLGCGLLMLPLGILWWPSAMPDLSAWASLLTLCLFSTAIAYFLFYSLIARIGASRASAVMFLIPVFGVVWGMIFLGERVNAGMLAGAVMVVLGVALINGLAGQRRPA